MPRAPKANGRPRATAETPLAPQQQQVFDYIAALMGDRGYCVFSAGKMSKALDFPHASSGFVALRAIVARGRLVRVRAVPGFGSVISLPGVQVPPDFGLPPGEARQSRGFVWTDAITTEAKRLYIDLGRSASAVGREIGCSRCAVMGKAYREGWQRDGSVARINASRNRPAVFKAPKPPRPKAQPRARVVYSIKTGQPVRDPVEPRQVRMSGEVPGSNPKPWLERLSGECCWPVSGDGADVMSCCAPASHIAGEGSVYCSAHWKARRNSVQSRVTDGDSYARSLRRYA